MSTDISLTTRSREENWLPILELAVEEVFEIMLGNRVKPVSREEHKPSTEFTAMVGLAGALCGILTVCCDRAGARELTKCMLGADVGESDDQVTDAMGEICNMIAGNFASGSAQIIPSSQPALDRIANLLRGRNCRLRIEGHTDDTPIHNSQFSSNWELSTARSTEVVRLLIVREGYDPKRLAAAGYAEFHPVASNSTAEGRSINRRLDIVVLNQEVAPVPGTPAATGPSPSPETKPTALVPSGQPAPG
jgi:hypothetical protein